MKARARWTVWIALSLGVYLLFAPEIWGVDGEAVSSLNSRMVGVCIVGVSMWTIGIPRLKGAEWIKVVLGCWLLTAPFALDYGGTAAWNDRIVGALTLATVGAGSDPFALLAWLRANTLRYRPQRITVRDIVEYQQSEEPEEPPSPEVLSQRIVECSEQIRRTLLGDPSEAEIETCALGCSTCMDDLITLALLIKEEQPVSGPVRRMKLGAAYRHATDSLSRARKALHLYTVSVPGQERSQK